MYIHPRSFLSRLLGAAWTILLISLLLWLAARLLAEAWMWLVGIIIVATLVRLGFLIRRLRQERRPTMSRKRGRSPRQYRLRVRTVRRNPIDYDALARAALEQAAMNQRDDTTTSPTDQHRRQRRHGSKRSKEPRHDRLA
jgi:hypothetical protein